MFTLIPVGKGMAMLQSKVIPEAEAQAKLDQLNAEYEEGPEEEMSEEPAGEMMAAMPERRPAAGRPGMPPEMPAFGRPTGAPGRGPARGKMPPYAGV